MSHYSASCLLAFLALTALSSRTVLAFSPNEIRSRHVSLKPVADVSSPSFELNAKFKLDNGEDDDDESFGSFVATKSQPSTTFGAEAVPEEQRPANEYLDLISAPFFDWANRPGGDTTFAIRLGALYTVTLVAVCWPISGATFTTDGYLFHKILSSHIGALGFILMFLLRLYSGWGYIGSRLTSKDIEYEETGWYDGDVEVKTEAEIARDLLLYRQDVKPVVERTKIFSLVAATVWVASCVGLNVLFQAKPLFNEYDPNMLERLVYDDKVASVAADQSNGVPTYCNSRYYRAVANGGQGCQ
jgi:hypothetical protein